METIMDTYRSCHIHSLQDIVTGILTGQARQYPAIVAGPRGGKPKASGPRLMRRLHCSIPLTWFAEEGRSRRDWIYLA